MSMIILHCVFDRVYLIV